MTTQEWRDPEPVAVPTEQYVMPGLRCTRCKDTGMAVVQDGIDDFHEEPCHCERGEAVIAGYGIETPTEVEL